MSKAIRIEDVPQYLPIEVKPRTIYKWCMAGCYGVLLRSWLIGGKRVTDEDSIQEFLEATNRVQEERRQCTAV